MQTLRDLKVGQRVQLHPATDRWMRGDRWGVVYKLGRKYAELVMEVSGHHVKVSPEDILI
jgi:hypothetical protein